MDGYWNKIESQLTAGKNSLLSDLEARQLAGLSGSDLWNAILDLTNTLGQFGDMLTIADNNALNGLIDVALASDPTGIYRSLIAPTGQPAFNTFFGQSKRVVCPIILDLDGNGVSVRPPEQGVYFDQNGDGYAERSAWTGTGDGFLVRDRNGDGKITTGNELFGDQTVMKGGGTGKNGFEVLKEYDDNQDGVIDGRDTIWSEMQVWQDTNGDGVSQAGELHALSDMGVQSVNLTYTRPGGQLAASGTYTKTDGSTARADDAIFSSNTWDTRPTATVAVPADIALLPDLQGYGTVDSLHQAMAKDGTGALRALVEQFAAEPAKPGREAILKDILLTWTNSNGINPMSRVNDHYGTVYDARKLNVIESFNGEGYVNRVADSGRVEYDPMPQSVPLFDKSYNALFETMYSGLMVQTHLKGLLDQVISNLPGLTLTGTAADDVLDGSLGKDRISGGAGNDILNGGLGADYLAGESGNDTLKGGGTITLTDAPANDDAVMRRAA